MSLIGFASGLRDETSRVGFAWQLCAEECRLASRLGLRSFFVLSHGWEEHVPDGRDGSLEAKINPVVNGLRAHDSALLCVHLEPANDPVRLVVLNTIKIGLINFNVTWNVIWAHAFKSLDFLHNELSVFLDGTWHDLFDEVFIAFTASQEQFGLHHFDESLNHEIFQQLLVSCLIRLHLLANLRLRLFFQFLNILVNFAHSLDSHLVLLLRLLNLHFDLFVLQLGFEVIVHDLLLVLNILIVFDGEFLLSSLLDAGHLLVSMLLDELDHVLEDSLGLRLTLCHILKYF